MKVATRHRRLASAGQRRRHDVDAYRRIAARGRSHGGSLGAGRAPDGTLPDLSGDSARDSAAPAACAPPGGARAGRDPCRDRGSARDGRERLVQGSRHRVYDLLSHAIPAIRAQARADPGKLVVRLSAPPPRARAAHARRDRAPAARAHRSRLRERRPLVARRGHRGVQTLRSRASAGAAADLDLRRAASRWRRTSRPFWTWNCQEARSSSATDRIVQRSSSVIATRASSATSSVHSSLAICLRRDVFVFPSRTDTFGLVMLEAIACGTPVAAYPVTGPIDVVDAGVNGVLDEDLRQAALRALTLDRASCARTALERTWPRATEQFLSHLVCARNGERLL